MDSTKEKNGDRDRSPFSCLRTSLEIEERGSVDLFLLFVDLCL